MPDRITLSRTKGWRMPLNTVNVSRGPGRHWGNPFIVGTHGDAATCVARYRNLATGLISMFPPCPPWLAQKAAQDHIRAHLDQLRGKNLACWCQPGQPCHADVLLEIANVP